MKAMTSNNQKALLKAKQTINIASFNTRTLTNISQRGELTASASLHKHDIVCVQEHCFFNDDALLKHHDVGNGWLLVTSSAVKNAANASIDGVGLLLSPKAQKIDQSTHPPSFHSMVTPKHP